MPRIPQDNRAAGITTFSQHSKESKAALKRSSGLIACVECTRLKLKCDKKVPCSTCVKRKLDHLCPHGTAPPIVSREKREENAPLYRYMVTLANRIKALEDALQEFQSGTLRPVVDTILGHNLLTIKDIEAPLETICDGHLPPSSGCILTEADGLTDSFGSLTIGEQGDAKYFGRSGGTEMILLAADKEQKAGGPMLGSVSGLDKLPTVFPFNTTDRTRWDVQASMQILLSFLPDKQRATTLLESYFTHGAYAGQFITRYAVFEMIMPPIYDYLSSHLGVFGPYSSRMSFSPHQLATLFLSLALGSLMDLNNEPDSDEADRYYELGRAALCLQPFYELTQLYTIYALVLMSSYHLQGNRRYSPDGAWHINGLCCKLAQDLSLHKENPTWKLDEKMLQTRRYLFWELFVRDTALSIVVGRPPTFSASHIDCPYPVAIVDENGKELYSPEQWYYRFSREVQAPIAEATGTAKTPSYQTILALDKTLREHAHLAQAKVSVLDFPDNDLERIHTSFSVYMKYHAPAELRVYSALYLHRSFFAQAILDHPENPLLSRYSASFLSAYRCASLVITWEARHYAMFPEASLRRWLWGFFLTAAIVVGSIAASCPQLAIAPKCFAELNVAISRFQTGASRSSRVRAGLALLNRIRDRAHDALTVHQPHDPEKEYHFEIFAGHTKVWKDSSISSQRRQESPEAPPTQPGPDFSVPFEHQPNQDGIDWDALDMDSFMTNDMVYDGTMDMLASMSHAPIPEYREAEEQFTKEPTNGMQWDAGPTTGINAPWNSFMQSQY